MSLKTQEINGEAKDRNGGGITSSSVFGGTAKSINNAKLRLAKWKTLRLCSAKVLLRRRYNVTARWFLIGWRCLLVLVSRYEETKFFSPVDPPASRGGKVYAFSVAAPDTGRDTAKHTKAKSENFSPERAKFVTG